MVTMKKSSTAYLMNALGKLPDARKKTFIKDALHTLIELHASAPSRRPNLPVDEHKALARVARQTASLIATCRRVRTCPKLFVHDTQSLASPGLQSLDGL